MHPQTHNAKHARDRGSGFLVAHEEAHRPCSDQNRQDMNSASRSPTSWLSDDEQLSPRASRYYSDLFSLYTQRQTDNVAPYNNREAASQAADARKPSTIIALSGSVAREFAELVDLQQRPTKRDGITPIADQSFLQKHYRTAKEIYRNGPPGEAQLFWEGIKSYLDERQRERDVFEMCPFERSDTAPQKPAPQIKSRKRGAAEPDTTKITENRETRQDSAVSYGDVSRTSREVPIKLRRTVLTVDVNKPLPPSPPLSIAPHGRSQKGKGKALDVNKLLPRTPFPCSLDITKTSNDGGADSTIDNSWPSTNVPKVNTAGPVRAPKVSQQSTQTCSKQTTQEEQLATSKDLPKPPPEARLQVADKSKSSKQEAARAALKASISLPIPIPSPPHGPDPYIVSPKGKGKHRKTPSTPTWFNKLAHPTLPTLPMMAIHKHHGKKRPDSDESFACQGLKVPAEGETELYTYVGDEGESVAVGGPRMRLYEGLVEREKVLRPRGLFTGSRADGSLFDVGDVWADSRATGRWI